MHANIHLKRWLLCVMEMLSVVENGITYAYQAWFELHQSTFDWLSTD